MQPPPRRIAEEPVAETEHSRLFSPACDAGARFRSIERHRTHYSEPAGVVPNRRKCHVGRTRVPTGRMNDGGIDTAFVHQGDGLLRGKGRHLSMREIARQAGSPEVDLGVDDLHHILPFIFTQMLAPPLVFTLIPESYCGLQPALQSLRSPGIAHTAGARRSRFRAVDTSIIPPASGFTNARMRRPGRNDNDGKDGPTAIGIAPDVAERDGEPFSP